MASTEQTAKAEEIASRTDGRDGRRSFMFGGAQAAPAVSWERSPGAGAPAGKAASPSRAGSAAELATGLSGLALVLFMFGHLGLLFSVVLGAGVMDDLAGFLEGYYLLHVATPFLILIIAIHVGLTMRRAPTTFRQQRALAGVMGRMGHLDTYTWALQVVSGVALLALAAIHLWVILTDLPIEAVKSGLRVNGSYMWLYIPFIVLVEAHMSLGIYRLAVKWGIVERLRAHLVLTAWTVVILAVGFGILAKFYSLGG